MICFSEGYNGLPVKIKSELRLSNLFFSEEYERNVNSRHQKLYYIWSECYVLVARIKSQLFLKAAVLESEPYKYSEGEEEKLFLMNSMKELKKHGVQWTICATTARFQDYPSDCVVVPCGNFLVDLTRTEDELWKNIHSKHRNSIRRGEKAGIEIRKGNMDLLDDYVKLSIETYLRTSDSTVGFSYYKGLVQELDDNSIIFIADKEGVPQSGGMFYYNNCIAYYLHGASVSRPEPGATNYLLWKAMMFFKERGVKLFSFVGYHYDPEPGSKLDGIQKFKERFGGELERSYNFRYVQNFFFYRLYCFAMQVKGKKPFIKYEDAIDKQLSKYSELNRRNI